LVSSDVNGRKQVWLWLLPTYAVTLPVAPTGAVTFMYAPVLLHEMMLAPVPDHATPLHAWFALGPHQMDTHPV
jgi:hypothetical protein